LPYEFDFFLFSSVFFFSASGPSERAEREVLVRGASLLIGLEPSMHILWNFIQRIHRFWFAPACTLLRCEAVDSSLAGVPSNSIKHFFLLGSEFNEF
jgi:hypothetical protein